MNIERYCKEVDQWLKILEKVDEMPTKEILLWLKIITFALQSPEADKTKTP